jgi:hypothetical protein
MPDKVISPTYHNLSIKGVKNTMRYGMIISKLNKTGKKQVIYKDLVELILLRQFIATKRFHTLLNG